MGLFHGSKPLCPNVSHVLKGSSDESGIYEVEKVTVFSIGQVACIDRFFLQRSGGLFLNLGINQLNT